MPNWGEVLGELQGMKIDNPLEAEYNSVLLRLFAATGREYVN